MPSPSAGAASAEPRVVARTRDHLFDFLYELHREGLPVPANKQLDYFGGIGMVEPATTGQLYWVGVATLVSSRTGQTVYDEVFRRFFGSAEDAMVVTEEEPEEPEDHDDPDEEQAAAPGDHEVDDLVMEDAGGSGMQAGVTNPETAKRFARTTPDALALMRQIRAELPEAVPHSRSRRYRTGRRQRLVDLRAVYLESRRTHGEIVRLRWRQRPLQPRRILVLIDVSGSMKNHSPDYLRFAHAVVGTGLRAEVFTFGTQLTRVTGSLRYREIDTALDALARVVLDADGGTLIGESLQEFLDNAHYVTMARGALVLVLSDGLERGDCTTMTEAVQRLSRLSHRLLWWSPLACDPAYEPVTKGMAAIVSDLDGLVGVRDLETALGGLRTGLSRCPTNHSTRRTCA